MNQLLFLVILQAVLVSYVFAQIRAVSRGGYCTKKEDLICFKRTVRFCKYRNFRFQCPRTCKVCVDKPVVPRHLEKADEARSAVTEAVQDILKSRILSSNSTKVVNLNQVNEVMFQIERSMGQADLSRKKYKLPKVKRDIKEALKLGNTRFARRMLAIALNTIGKSSSGSARRRKRSTKKGAKKFLDDLKKEVGDKAFSKLLALEGGKTLMFAIDTTGSMSGEIEAAKAIATEITTFKRRNPPNDYVLSWFSDPEELGGSIHKKESEVKEFINAIERLEADAGDDCPEYALSGMFEAVEKGPVYGSPLFVFTDASPKDGDEDNVDMLIMLAEENKVTVTFFTEESCSVPPDSTFEIYKRIASETGGYYVRTSDTELRSLAKFTDTSLGSSTTVAFGGSEAKGRKRRSTMDEILIPLDDTITELVISTTFENNVNGISLQAPSGLAWTEGVNRLSNAAIYIVDSPTDGNWTLQIPVDAGNYRYTVKASSAENINFNHRYMKHVNRKILEIKSPLAGEPTQLELTISGAKQTQKDTLLMDIVDIHGKVLIPDLKPKRNDESGQRYNLTFNPPSEQFKLQIKGRTSKNKMFQRVSQSVSQARPLVLKMFYTSETIKRGGSAFIMLYLFNGLGDDQVFSVSFKDTLGYKVSLLGRRPIKRVRAKSKTFLRVAVRYGGRKRGRVGQDENVIILVRYGSHGASTTEVVTFMVK